jgi:hypothetical protein
VSNPIGQRLQSQGVEEESLIRSPRAVDSMKVTLEKIALSDADKQTFQKITRSHGKD